MHTHHEVPPNLSPPLCRGYPLVGVLPGMLHDAPSELLRISRCHPGSVCRAMLGPMQLYLVTHPAHVQEVLADKWQNFGKGGMYLTLRRLLGDSLFTSEGDEWVRHRRFMQPLFTAKHLSSVTDIMAEVVAAVIPRYEAAADAGAAVDVVEEISRLTEAVIIEAMFGGSITRIEAEALAKALAVAVDTLLPRMFVSFLPEWFPLPGDRAFRKAVSSIDQVMLRLIQARCPREATQKDLLSMLLDAHDDKVPAMGVRQIRDHLVTFFVAGTVTSADTVIWLLYLLAKHPEVEQNLRLEVDRVLGGQKPNFSDLANLPYTRMVVMETMRLYPAAWFFPRFSRARDTLGGMAIPGGSTVLLSPYVTHREPTFWPRPEVFDPERFSPAQSAGRPRFAYMPFGGGPHQCIGMQFALTEVQIITAMLVQRFRLRLVAGRPIIPKGSGSLKPRHGLKLVFTRA